MRYRGGCHCGDVRFEIEAPAEVEVLECNCSMCRRLAYLHLIVPRERFALLAGEAALASYRFGTGVAEHLFCRRCGVKSFYVPRSHPDAYSVNARCLDEDAGPELSVRRFDGRHWEEAAARLAR